MNATSTDESFERLHKSRVLYFQSLYEQVMRAMEDFRENPNARLDQSDDRWISYLIKGFKERFDNWIPTEDFYLRKLYKKDAPLVMLTGHAYLHIAFDLPIIIGDSLSRCDNSEPLITVSRGSEIFEQLEHALSKALRADWRKPFLVDRALAHNLDDALLGWMIGLRNTAWKHGVAIAEADEPSRSQVIERLHRDVTAKLMKALRRRLCLFVVTAFCPPNAAKYVGVCLPWFGRLSVQFPRHVDQNKYPTAFVVRSFFRGFESPSVTNEGN
jgi:hypothetical protein